MLRGDFGRRNAAAPVRAEKSVAEFNFEQGCTDEQSTIPQGDDLPGIDGAFVRQEKLESGTMMCSGLAKYW